MSGPGDDDIDYPMPEAAKNREDNERWEKGSETSQRSNRSIRLSQSDLDSQQKAYLAKQGITEEIQVKDVMQTLQSRDASKKDAEFFKKFTMILLCVAVVLLAGVFGTSYFAVEVSKESHVTDGSLVDLNGETIVTNKEVIETASALAIFGMSEKHLAGLTRIKWTDPKDGSFHAMGVEKVVKTALVGEVSVYGYRGDVLTFLSELQPSGQRKKFMLHSLESRTSDANGIISHESEVVAKVPLGTVDSMGRRLAVSDEPSGFALDCEGQQCPGNGGDGPVPVSNKFALLCVSENNGEDNSDSQQGLCVDASLESDCEDVSKCPPPLCTPCDSGKETQAFEYDESKKILKSCLEGCPSEDCCFYLTGPTTVEFKADRAEPVEFGDNGQLIFLGGGRRLKAAETAGGTQRLEVFPHLGGRRLQAPAELQNESGTAEARRLGGSGCGFWEILAGAGAFFKTGGEYGNHCGKGHPMKCSNNGKPTKVNSKYNTGYQSCNDGGYDDSCFWHDKGACVWNFAGGKSTMSQCSVDQKFQQMRRAAYNRGNRGFSDGGITAGEFYAGAECTFTVMPCKQYHARLCSRQWESRWWGGWWFNKCRNSYWESHYSHWGNYGGRTGCDGDCYQPSGGATTSLGKWNCR